jgi:hypothetical protein
MNPYTLQFIRDPWACVRDFSVDWLFAANDEWAAHGVDAAFLFLMGA